MSRLTKLATAGAAVLLLAGTAGVAYAGTDQPPGPQPGAQIIGGHQPSQVYDPMGSLQLTHPRTGEPDFHTCGAELVFGRWALTQAHCVTDAAGKPYPLDWNWHIRFGSNDRTTGGVTANILEIIPHEQWAWGAIPGLDVHDAAMLRLDRYIDLIPYNIPVKAPAVGGRTRLIGWGLTEPDGEGPVPTQMRELDVRRVADSRCAAGGISGGEICLGNVNGTDGPCNGDSGSPGLHRRDGRWTLVAGASRGAGDCGLAPTIYTDWTAHRDWVYHVARHGTTPAPPAARPAGDLRTLSALTWADQLAG